MKQLVFTLLVFGAVGRCQTPTLDNNYYLNSGLACIFKLDPDKPLDGNKVSSAEIERRGRNLKFAATECDKTQKRAIRDRYDCVVDDRTGGHLNGCWWRNNDTEAKFSFLEGFIAGQPVPLSTVELLYAKHLALQQIADLLDIYYHDAVNLTTPLFAAIKIVAPAL